MLLLFTLLLSVPFVRGDSGCSDDNETIKKMCRDECIYLDNNCESDLSTYCGQPAGTGFVKDFCPSTCGICPTVENEEMETCTPGEQRWTDMTDPCAREWCNGKGRWVDDYEECPLTALEASQCPSGKIDENSCCGTCVPGIPVEECRTGELYPVSYLECDNCKCAGDVIRKKHVGGQVTRVQCEEMAIKEGVEYYNWLSLGRTGVCVFGKDGSRTDLSLTDACVAPNRIEDTQRHWQIYSIRQICDECKRENVVAAEVCNHCKCDGLMHIQARAPNTKHADDYLDCAWQAHQAGHRLFSFKSEDNYCYYGLTHSSELACMEEKYETKSEKWSIFEMSCAQESP